LYFCASYREGFSTSCQEAALLGIPVVSVEVGGAHELKELTNCGSVIKNDKKSICKELSKILKKWNDQAQISKFLFYKKERIKKLHTILEEGIY
jgi:predicted glycosyltransferase